MTTNKWTAELKNWILSATTYSALRQAGRMIGALVRYSLCGFVPAKWRSLLPASDIEVTAGNRSIGRGIDRRLLSLPDWRLCRLLSGAKQHLDGYSPW